MTLHDLKISSLWFDAVKNGIKKCEIRRADRDYRVGDTLRLREVDANTGKDMSYADDNLCINLYFECLVTITHIITHDDFPEGVPEGYCVLSIEVVA